MKPKNESETPETLSGSETLTPVSERDTYQGGALTWGHRSFAAHPDPSCCNEPTIVAQVERILS